MALPRNFNSEEVTRLKTIIDEGVRTLEEVESLQSGLNDTIRAIADELEIPVKVLKRAIKTSQKHNFDDHKDELSSLEELLDITKRK